MSLRFQAPHFDARRLWIALLALAGLVLLLLSACAGSGDSDDSERTATVEPTSVVESDPLDCETQGFPCLWSDVDPAVRTRALDLAHEVADRLSAGSAPEAAAWLQTQGGIAELISDDEGVRFRLDGGRPVWVLPRDPDFAAAGRQSTALASANWSIGRTTALAPPARTSAASGTPAGSRVAPGTVVGEGREDKSAIVVAPFAWSADMDVGVIAGVIENTRGYAGHVVTLRNGSAAEQTVSVDTFASLDGYDVVYVRTLGGGVCPVGQQTAPAGQQQDCHAVIAVSELLNREYHILDEQASILDIIVWEDGTESLAVEADFFRQAYRGGISNAMLFFDTYLQRDPNFIRAIKGYSSEFYFWNGSPLPMSRSGSTSVEVPAELLSELSSTGLSSETVVNGMLDRLTANGVRFDSLRPGSITESFRIREVVQLKDPSGIELHDGSVIVVDGDFGDGNPDKIKVAVHVEGLPKDEVEHTTINLVVDGEQQEPKLPADGTRNGEFDYTVTWVIQMDDLEEGQEIELQAIAQLVEGGLSQQTAVVVAGTVDIGTVWEGVSDSTSPTFFPGVTVTRHATITFTRDPDEGPNEQVVTFHVTAGTMTWGIEGSSGDCVFDAGPIEVPLPTGGANQLVFDLRDAAAGVVTYYGEGNVHEGPEITVSKVCGGKDESYKTSAGGVYFLAPQDEDLSLTGLLAEDTWSSGAQLGSSFQWSLHRVE